MSRPEHWLRPELKNMAPYAVADATGLIKLDAMENPHPLPPGLEQAWGERLAALAVNRYPDAAATALKTELRRAMAIPDHAGLLLGNGSDEILQILMLALARPGACMVTPEPGFAMFALIARAVGLRYVGVPLGPGFALDAPALLAAIERERPALVVIAQPNNPTGNAFDRAAVAEVVAAAPGAALIDEAYYPFAAGHCLDWLGKYDNLLIMRTVSKLGLAGLRLGLLAGPRAWLDALEPLRLPYNVNALTQAAGTLAMTHYDAFMAQAGSVVAERERLAAALAREGVTVYPSQANFLLVRVPKGFPGVWHARLRDAGLLVKNLENSHPQTADCLRITVGLPAENDALIGAWGRL